MNRSKRPIVSDEIQDVRSAVRVVLRRLVGTEDPEYEDLEQSAIENVLVTFERGRFRGDCPPGGWAAVIARNVAVDALRARSRERQLFAHDPGDPAAGDGAGGLDTRVGPMGPEHLLGVQERLGRLKGALLGLGMHKANVVFMHDVLGHELSDIAPILRITVAAAQSRLVRGRREIIAQIDLPERGQGPGQGNGNGHGDGHGDGMKSRVAAVVTKARAGHPSPAGKQRRKFPFTMLS